MQALIFPLQRRTHMSETCLLGPPHTSKFKRPLEQLESAQVLQHSKLRSNSGNKNSQGGNLTLLPFYKIWILLSQNQNNHSLTKHTIQWKEMCRENLEPRLGREYWSCCHAIKTCFLILQKIAIVLTLGRKEEVGVIWEERKSGRLQGPMPIGSSSEVTVGVGPSLPSNIHVHCRSNKQGTAHVAIGDGTLGAEFSFAWHMHIGDRGRNGLPPSCSMALCKPPELEASWGSH